jgi:hypothetical protein
MQEVEYDPASGPRIDDGSLRIESQIPLLSQPKVILVVSLSIECDYIMRTLEEQSKKDVS